jgi:hypothetical protein
VVVLLGGPSSSIETRTEDSRSFREPELAFRERFCSVSASEPSVTAGIWALSTRRIPQPHGVIHRCQPRRSLHISARTRR